MKSTKTTGTAYAKTYAGTTQHEMPSQKSPAGNYEFTYGRTDAQGLPVIEQAEHDNQGACLEHDPVTGEPLMLPTSSGMQSLYVHDGTGSPVALITNEPYVAFAYAYDPYGTPVLTQVSGGNAVAQNPYAFKDGTQDRTTGWVKYGARWYNPAIGRWTQQDTLDAPLDPANANRYAYAANDPINNADPLGLVTSQCLISGGVTAGLGLISVALAIGAVGATGTILGAPAGAVLTAGSLAVGGGPAASLTYSLFVCL